MLALGGDRGNRIAGGFLSLTLFRLKDVTQEPRVSNASMRKVVSSVFTLFACILFFFVKNSVSIHLSTVGGSVGCYLYCCCYACVYEALVCKDSLKHASRDLSSALQES
jgi:hypothetical protein